MKGIFLSHLAVIPLPDEGTVLMSSVWCRKMMGKEETVFGD